MTRMVETLFKGVSRHQAVRIGGRWIDVSKVHFDPHVIMYVHGELDKSEKAEFNNMVMPGVVVHYVPCLMLGK